MKNIFAIMLSVLVNSCSPAYSQNLEDGQTVILSGFCETEEAAFELAAIHATSSKAEVWAFFKDKDTKCFLAALGHFGDNFTAKIIGKAFDVVRSDGVEMRFYKLHAPWIRGDDFGWTWALLEPDPSA